MKVLSSILTALAGVALALYAGSARGPVRTSRTSAERSVARVVAGMLHRLLSGLRRSPPSPLWEEVLYSLAFHIKAGEALPQAIRAVAEEGSVAPYEALKKAARAYEAGASMLHALQSASERSFEFRRLSEAVEIGITTGGDIPLLLCHTAENLAKRRSLLREARAKMAESMLTAVILSAMPWFIGAVTYRYDPSMMAEALSTPAGRAVMAVSLGLWLLGNIAIALTLSSVRSDKVR